jgi:hypothetical protein
MDSHQIDVILSKVLGKKRFRGVYASDKIPTLVGPFPYGLVINTDKEGQPGKHWQALWAMSANHVEFFDSFGDAPRGPIKEFLSDKKKVMKNKTKVQANYEISCGPFVIYYLIQRSKGHSIIDIVNKLFKNKFIDTFVKLFVSNLLIKL